MGEVYAAEDTRLHRKVAIKVLPTLLAHDPERRQRFEREAQAVAALNHPNIVTIHSVEEDNGVPFLTMELVEGKPLSEIVTPGGLPFDMLLRVGIAVSDAMAVAHLRGITHRDLKPGNIMLTSDGRVKVLDFGLAKLREAQVDAMADEVTRGPAGDLTGEGRILGTVAYMSPEQAEGKPVDGRSDVFSLGVVLHELATGQKPFKGDTNVSLISSILKDTPPPIADVNPSLPAGITRVVRRALAKDPSRRYQTATDLRNDLEDLKEEVESGIRSSVSTAPVHATRGPRLNRVALATVLLVLVAAFGAAYSYWKSRSPAVASEFLTIDRPERLTSTGNAALAAISPDGRYVAHVKNEPGAPSLWMRQTATTSDVEIVAGAPVRYAGVSWAPDGNHVFYVTYEIAGGLGTLYRIPALGGMPQKILEDIDSRISFSPDGSQFTFARGYPAEGTAWVMIANADGTNVRKLAELQKPDQIALQGPAWSSDGRTIVAPARSLRDGPHMLIVAIDVASGEVTRLEGRWNSVLDLEWVRGTQTFVAPVADLLTASPQLWQFSYPGSERRRLTNDLNTYASVSLSADGTALTTVQAEAVSNLFVSAFDKVGEAVQITRGRGRADGQTGLDWTPDGQIVFVSGASGRQQVWIADAEGRNVRQLTASPQEPVFRLSVTPDGKYIVFQRFSDRHMRIWRMRLDGSEQRIITNGELDQAPVAAPGGMVYFNRIVNGTPRTFKVPIEGGEAVQVSEHNFRPLDVSPDGSQLLGIAWDAKAQRSVLGIMPAAADAPPRLLAGLPTFTGGFSVDGKSIIFPVVGRGTVQIDRADLASGKVEVVGSVPDFAFNGSLSADGKRIVLSRGGVVSDVLLLTLK
jgi:serine/threonine protein kinase/Tol biopolymer transport system component